MHGNSISILIHQTLERSPFLEDHPRTWKWLRLTIMIVSPLRIRLLPFQMAFFTYKWGSDPNYVSKSSGPILQVLPYLPVMNEGVWINLGNLWNKSLTWFKAIWEGITFTKPPFGVDQPSGKVVINCPDQYPETSLPSKLPGAPGLLPFDLFGPDLKKKFNDRILSMKYWLFNTHMIHLWYICLHLPYKSAKCR